MQGVVQVYRILKQEVLSVQLSIYFTCCHGVGCGCLSVDAQISPDRCYRCEAESGACPVWICF